MDFSVERGVPTDEELAAIVGVLYARRATKSTEDDKPAPSRWAASARPGFTQAGGRPARRSRDGWRASGLPR